MIDMKNNQRDVLKLRRNNCSFNLLEAAQHQTDQGENTNYKASFIFDNIDHNSQQNDEIESNLIKGNYQQEQRSGQPIFQESWDFIGVPEPKAQREDLMSQTQVVIKPQTNSNASVLIDGFSVGDVLDNLKVDGNEMSALEKELNGIVETDGIVQDSGIKVRVFINMDEDDDKSIGINLNSIFSLGPQDMPYHIDIKLEDHQSCNELVLESIQQFNKRLSDQETNSSWRLDDRPELVSKNFSVYKAKKKGQAKDDYPSYSMSINVKKTQVERFSLSCFSTAFIGVHSYNTFKNSSTLGQQEQKCKGAKSVGRDSNDHMKKKLVKDGESKTLAPCGQLIQPAHIRTQMPSYKLPDLKDSIDNSINSMSGNMISSNQPSKTRRNITVTNSCSSNPSKGCCNGVCQLF